MPAPRALLLDFGGVIADSPRRQAEEVLPRVAQRVKQLTGDLLTEDEIVSELRRADAMRDRLRDSAHDYAEVTPVRLWGELVADLWPQDARERLVAHAGELTYLWSHRPSWRLVDGIAELLDHTVAVGLPVAVVSNTRCGQAHRDVLERLGVAPAFAVQIYSDEIGVCKPHPEMIWSAARALNVPASACWMVGDTLHKDVACARKAGAGAAILMITTGSDSADGDDALTDRASGLGDADATVRNGQELLRLLG